MVHSYQVIRLTQSRDEKVPHLVLDYGEAEGITCYERHVYNVCVLVCRNVSELQVKGCPAYGHEPLECSRIGPTIPSKPRDVRDWTCENRCGHSLQALESVEFPQMEQHEGKKLVGIDEASGDFHRMGRNSRYRTVLTRQDTFRELREPWWAVIQCAVAGQGSVARIKRA
jgi:hypothetical protein